MNILKLAREAGLRHDRRYAICSPGSLQRFADLVLEEAAKVCESAVGTKSLTHDVATTIRAMKAKL